MIVRRGLMFLMLLLVVLTGCDLFKKEINWNTTLAKKSKDPYGSYLAYQSLKYFFPHTSIIDLSPGFRYSSIDEKMTSKDDGNSLLIAVGLDYYLSQAELQHVVDFANAGNDVMIFSRVIDKKLETMLRCTIEDNGQEDAKLTKENNGAVNRDALILAHSPEQYGYEGRSILGHFKVYPDTATAETVEEEDQEEEAYEPPFLTDTIGYVRQHPNILRYAVGEGHIILHSAPLVLSNYFLLQNDNRRYVEALWTALDRDYKTIYWNDYYKRTIEQADWNVLLKYPAIRWAFFLALFALLIYVIFQAKRRQRIVPIIAPLENSSVSFVETVGRLYYNKRDHRNLGEKMIQHFLEWVRSHYFINTNHLNEQFRQQLAFKSGLPDEVITSMMELIREIHIERKPISETDLYHLHYTIQQFYKNKP
jgi:hypothetical protein